jgi:hypothetical protein
MKRAKDLHRLSKNFLELKINGAGGAVIINIGIKVEACIEKHGQCIQPSFIQNQSLSAKGGVMEKSSPIDWAY